MTVTQFAWAVGAVVAGVLIVGAARSLFDRAPIANGSTART